MNGTALTFFGRSISNHSAFIHSWHRLDKFYYLIRVIMISAVNMCRSDAHVMEAFNQQLQKSILNASALQTNKIPLALFRHFVETFNEAVEAAVEGDWPDPATLLLLFKPFIQVLEEGLDGKLAQMILDSVLVPAASHDNASDILMHLKSRLEQGAFKGTVHHRVKRTLQEQGLLSTTDAPRGPKIIKSDMLMKPVAAVKDKSNNKKQRLTSSKELMTTDVQIPQVQTPAINCTDGSRIRLDGMVERKYFRPPNFSVYPLTMAEHITVSPQKVKGKRKRQSMADDKRVHFGKNRVAVFDHREPATSSVVPNSNNNQMGKQAKTTEEPLRIEMSIVECGPSLDDVVQEASDDEDESYDGRPSASDFMSDDDEE